MYDILVEQTEKKCPTVMLRSYDFFVSRNLKAADASPFLALSLELKYLVDTRGAIQNLMRSGYTPKRLFREFPNVTAWAICATLFENYGQGTQDVWSHIDNLFGIDSGLNIRDEIVKSFKFACQKIGIVTDGFDRNVDMFLVHVGVASGQLGHVAKAFLQQEAASGLPSSDDVVQLNRWEDDAVLTFLPHGVQVPLRPILLDETAWMATLFLNWRSDAAEFRQQNTFAAAFADALEKAEKLSGCASSSPAQPSPRMIWLDGRPQIQVPAGAGRLLVYMGEQILRLRRGQYWPLPTPLPCEMTWVVNEEKRCLPLYNSPFVFFEPENGRQLVPHKGSRELTVQASVVVVTSSKEFTVDGNPAMIFGPNLYVAHVNLQKATAELHSGEKTIILKGSKRTRIYIEGDPIAVHSGKVGKFWSKEAEIVVEAALYSDPNVSIKVECNGIVKIINRTLNDTEVGRIPLLELLNKLDLDQSKDPVKLMLTLMRKGEDDLVETRIKREIFVWPTFLGLKGVVLECTAPPESFVVEASNHVSKDDTGQLCLDRNGGFDKALVAFRINNEIHQFLVDWPETSIILEKSNGVREVLPLGSALVLGQNDWNGSLVVRSPNRQASLLIAGRLMERPFLNTASWTIPLRQLQKSKNNRILLVTEVSQLLLASVETVDTPTELEVSHSADGATAKISVAFPIGGAMITGEDEKGDKVSSEYSFDHFPEELIADQQISVQKYTDNTVFINFKNNPLSDGLQLFDVSLRETGQQNWTRLLTHGGDRISFGASPLENSLPTVQKMTQLNNWMEQCFASECWTSGLSDILVNRWSTNLRGVNSEVGGRSAILCLAHAGELDTNWLPMKHAFEALPEFHCADAFDYAALKSVASPVGRALSVMSSFPAGNFRKNDSISPHGFFGFKNARTA